jgi:hypothetical protein
LPWKEKGSTQGLPLAGPDSALHLEAGGGLHLPELQTGFPSGPHTQVEQEEADHTVPGVQVAVQEAGQYPQRPGIAAPEGEVAVAHQAAARSSVVQEV